MSYTSDIKKVDRTKEAEGFPEVILIDNCNCCNLRCTMCDHQNMTKYRPFGIMDIKLYRKIIDEIALENPAARVWEIFFGDPFLCPDMDVRIKYAKDKGLKDVVLNSNGMLMTETKARAYIEVGLDAMYIGIDAAAEETYSKIRVGGDFETVKKNVLGYQELLSKYGNPGQKLFVQFVVSDINEAEIESFKSFWAQKGVNVKIRPKISWAGLVGAENLRDNKETIRKPCYWVMKTINICVNGDISFCSVDLHCRVKCGNVRDSSIKEIWSGKLKDYRMMHKEGRFNDLPDLCRDCRDWQSGYADFVISK